MTGMVLDRPRFISSGGFKKIQLVWVGLLAGYLICSLASPAGALTMYPDQMGTSVTFTNISEDTGTEGPLRPPLFGPPTVAGNSLDFSPVSFNSTSTGAGGNDVTDGALTMMIVAKPGFAIPAIKIDEAGDFTLLGLGGLGTFASVMTNVFIDIVAVDGVPMDEINGQFQLTYSPSGGTYNLLEDGPGPLVNGIWTGDGIFNVMGALAAAGKPFVLGATKVNVTLDNTLVTLSQAGTTSLIAKKDHGVVITVIPEPASATLLALGLIALVACGRRRLG